MFRRLTAVGAPPLLLILGTILLVHYPTVLPDTVVAEEMPRAWRQVVIHLPILLAILGLGMGLRMRSCGVLIAMLTAATVAMGINSVELFNGILSGKFHWTLKKILFLPPVAYLAGRWAFRFSWWSRNGFFALAVVAFWGSALYLAGTTDQGVAIISSAQQWFASLPMGRFLSTTPWGQSLPSVVVAMGMVAHAIRRSDPV